MHRTILLPILLLAGCIPEAGALPDTIDHDVPFIVQAPLGNWDDLRKGEGCEEASVLMASAWAKGETALSPEEADRRINEMVEFERKTFGEFRDTSIEDTAKLLQDFAGRKSRLEYGTDAEDLRRILADGNIALIPVDATKLPTPGYDGPPRHMIVIRGYDAKAKVFIANDPGTRGGDGIRYSFEAIEAALKNYPTGDETTVAAPSAERRPAMLVVVR